MSGHAERSIILTGATGFLGAFLMAALLTRGYHVTVLGRSARDLTLAARLAALVRWFGLPDPGGRLLALETDFSKHHLGLTDEFYNRLCGSAAKIVHCASDTSFAERNRAQVMAANVDNLAALLNLAAEAGTGQLYYVSTAYAAGKREGICLEQLDGTRCFTNVYEESKAKAEEIISRFCENHTIPLAILRPSIVCGHSATGAALRFNALYVPVKSLSYIRDIYKKDILEQGGTQASRWNIQLGEDGILKLPLEVYLPEGGFVNLIPVDYFVDAALCIIEQEGAAGIYHITSDHPPLMATLIDYAEQFLGVRGIRTLPDEALRTHPANPVEELLEKFVAPYHPYLSDRRIFDRSRIDSMTAGLKPPEFTYEMFARCMNYAIARDWGRKALP
jgi:nucleoside-diphosphate-sugar epimerase